jgi:hypothetical protein
MSNDPPATLGPLPPDAIDRIDRVCDRFEAAWRASRRPRIEEHLDGAERPERSALLRELLLSEIECREKAGGRPDPLEYRNRFQQDAALIAEVFGGEATGD